MKRLGKVAIALANGVSAFAVLSVMPSWGGPYGPGQYSSLLDWDLVGIIALYGTAGALSLALTRLPPLVCAVCAAVPFAGWAGAVVLSSRELSGIHVASVVASTLGILTTPGWLGATGARRFMVRRERRFSIGLS